MPSLPIYNSNRNIQPTTGEPLRNEAAQSFEAGNNLLDQMQRVTQKISTANDEMQLTRFKTSTEKDIALQKSVAQNDPDQYNEEAHLKALKEIKQRYAGTISNKAIEEQAMADLDKSIFIAGLDINNTFKKKQVLTNEMNLDSLVLSLAQKKSASKTPTQALEVDKEMFNAIQGNVAKELITEAKGRKLLDDYRLGRVDLDIMNDGATTKEGSYVYAELKKGQSGAYSDLTDKERADRLEKTELHIGRNKKLNTKATTQAQDTNERALLIKQDDGSLTEIEIKNSLVATGIRPEFADKLYKSMYIAPPEKTEYSAYNNIKMMQLRGDKAREINQNVLGNLSNLTSQDKRALLEKSYNPLDKETINIKASAQALKEWASNTFDRLNKDESASNEILYNFFQRLDKGGDVDSTIKEVQRDYTKKYFPKTALLTDVPNIIGTRNKIQSVYQKESKAKGEKVGIKPVSTIATSTNIDFDDL